MVLRAAISLLLSTLFHARQLEITGHIVKELCNVLSRGSRLRRGELVYRLTEVRPSLDVVRSSCISVPFFHPPRPLSLCSSSLTRSLLPHPQWSLKRTLDPLRPPSAPDRPVKLFGGPFATLFGHQQSWPDVGDASVRLPPRPPHGRDAPYLRRTLLYMREGGWSSGRGRGGAAAARNRRRRKRAGADAAARRHLPKADVLLRVFRNRGRTVARSGRHGGRSGRSAPSASPSASPLSPLGRVPPSARRSPSAQLTESPTSKILKMKFGRALPPYQPMDTKTGEWNPPAPPRTAFMLFSHLSSLQVKRQFSIREVNRLAKDELEAKIQSKLKEMWSQVTDMAMMYWKQEEEWDRQRYLDQKALFVSEQMIAGIESSAKDSDGSDSDIVETKMDAQPRPRYRGPLTPTLVYYHCFFLDEGHPVALIDRRHNARCPFCSLECMTDVGLKMHLDLVHGGDLVSFEAFKDELCNVSVQHTPLDQIYVFGILFISLCLSLSLRNAMINFLNITPSCFPSLFSHCISLAAYCRPSLARSQKGGGKIRYRNGEAAIVRFSVRSRLPPEIHASDKGHPVLHPSGDKHRPPERCCPCQARADTSRAWRVRRPPLAPHNERRGAHPAVLSLQNQHPNA